MTFSVCWKLRVSTHTQLYYSNSSRSAAVRKSPRNKSSTNSATPSPRRVHDEPPPPRKSIPLLCYTHLTYLHANSFNSAPCSTLLYADRAMLSHNIRAPSALWQKSDLCVCCCCYNHFKTTPPTTIYPKKFHYMDFFFLRRFSIGTSFSRGDNDF